MSRIGKLPISIPAGVTVTLKDNVVTVKGPKGEMSQYVNPAINVAIEDGHVTLTENDKEMLDNPKQKHAFHGLYRSLVHNMVVGVSEGYKKELELVGVGYRASNQGNIIELALGYTHNIFIQLPAEVKVKLSLKEIRILLLYWNRVTNNCLVKFALKYVLSVSLNHTRVKVLSLLAK